MIVVYAGTSADLNGRFSKNLFTVCRSLHAYCPAYNRTAGAELSQQAVSNNEKAVVFLICSIILAAQGDRLWSLLSIVPISMTILPGVHNHQMSELRLFTVSRKCAPEQATTSRGIYLWYLALYLLCSLLLLVTMIGVLADTYTADICNQYE